MSLLKKLGFDEIYYGDSLAPSDWKFTIARITEHQRGLYRLAGVQAGLEGEWWADVSGKLYHAGLDLENQPLVGDWVLASPGSMQDRLQIIRILPRKYLIMRQATGSGHQAQGIAANVDHILVVSSLNQELNVRRLERYRALGEQSGAMASLILTKADLVVDQIRLSAVLDDVQKVFTETLLISAVTGEGLENLLQMFKPGLSYALIGSSGVGKSTLANLLLCKDKQLTSDIRDSDSRGRHTTSSRSLFTLPGGALLMDTPGIRELALWDLGSDSLEQSFEDITLLASSCRYRDCQHQSEPGCEVLAAIDRGDLAKSRFANYRKLQREQEFWERRHDKKKQKEERGKWKAIQKAHRQKKKLNLKNNY